MLDEIEGDYTNEQRAELVASLGLTVESVFVPYSKSRNAAEKWVSLNWKVTLKRNGREVVTTDYGAGMAHAPAYNKPENKQGRTEFGLAAIRKECESGFTGFGIRREPILPDSLAVLSSFVLDSDVLEHGTFESWASDCGYDVDSRKAETIYRACLEIALKLRAWIGDDGLAKLRRAFEGY